MSRYKRRDATVNAEQFDPAKKPWPDGIKEAEGFAYPYVYTTPAGPCRIDPLDWLVTDKNGIRIRIKPALFLHMFKLDEVA